MSTENQAERIRDGFQFFIAKEDEMIVGLIAIRLPCHLYYLFVRPDRQRQGIGRQLWNWARERIKETSQRDEFTVNSSLNAIAAYERLGFFSSGPIDESNGVRYQPMRTRMGGALPVRVLPTFHL
jgi:GNAT superfamily N-acetyltransferase